MCIYSLYNLYDVILVIINILNTNIYIRRRYSGNVTPFGLCLRDIANEKPLNFKKTTSSVLPVLLCKIQYGINIILLLSSLQSLKGYHLHFIKIPRGACSGRARMKMGGGPRGGGKHIRYIYLICRKRFRKLEWKN